MHSFRATRHDIRDFLRQAGKLGLSANAVRKLRWFLFYLDHAENVSKTCRHFSIARSTFLLWAERFDPKDLSSLEELSRSPHNVRQPDFDQTLIDQITICRKRFPLLGKEGICSLMEKEFARTTSTATVGRIIARFGLYFADTASHKQKRAAFFMRDALQEDIRSEKDIPSTPIQKKQDEASGLDSASSFPVFGS